jgi:hypothetical protein
MGARKENFVVDPDSGKLGKSLTSTTVFNLYGSNHRVNYVAIQGLLGELSELSLEVSLPSEDERTPNLYNM